MAPGAEMLFGVDIGCAYIGAVVETIPGNGRRVLETILRLEHQPAQLVRVICWKTAFGRCGWERMDSSQLFQTPPEGNWPWHARMFRIHQT